MIVLLIKTIIIGVVISPGYAANILAVFPHQGLSHHFVYLPHLQELSNRGHNVTVISNYLSMHPNITDVSIRGIVPIENNKKNISSWSQSKNDIYSSIQIMESFYTRGIPYKAMFSRDDVNKILNGPQNYDLLLTEHFNHELSLVFALKFNIPFILMSSCNLLPWSEQAIGQPHELATKPLSLTSLPPKMNFYQRFMNAMSYAVQQLGYTIFCRKRDEESIKEKLNINVSLDNFILNASLIYTNTHFTMFGSRSLVPAVVEVGGIHIKPTQILPLVSVFFCYNNDFGCLT